jgi:hypothetical protein
MNMRKLIGLVVILLFACKLALAQWGGAGGGKLETSELKAPVVKWTKEEFNFGNIKQNKPVNVEFELSNAGNAPLIITKVEPSCGCTTSDYTKAPIAPGQKGKVKVTFDAKTLGNFSKSVNVTTNAQEALTVIKFYGTVEK